MNVEDISYESFLLEDDDAIGMGLKYSLEKEGFAVTHAGTLAQAKSDFWGGSLLSVGCWAAGTVISSA